METGQQIIQHFLTFPIRRLLLEINTNARDKFDNAKRDELNGHHNRVRPMQPASLISTPNIEKRVLFADRLSLQRECSVVTW